MKFSENLEASKHPSLEASKCLAGIREAITIFWIAVIHIHISVKFQLRIFPEPGERLVPRSETYVMLRAPQHDVPDSANNTESNLETIASDS